LLHRLCGQASQRSDAIACLFAAGLTRQHRINDPRTPVAAAARHRPAAAENELALLHRLCGRA
jgi:hypothetical protein